jgi:hypothetical protein
MKFGIAMGTIVPKIVALSVALVLLIAISANRVFGQARPSPMENVVSVDPLPLAYSYPLILQYEYKAGPVYSWCFRFNYWPNPNTYTGSGFGIGAGYRVYIADSRALTGLSVAPAADIYFFRQAQLGYSEIAFEIGGDAAYKWIFDDFAIEPLFGFRIGFGPVNTPANATGAHVLIGFAGGYAF